MDVAKQCDLQRHATRQLFLAVRRRLKVIGALGQPSLILLARAVTKGQFFRDGTEETRSFCSAEDSRHRVSCRNSFSVGLVDERVRARLSGWTRPITSPVRFSPQRK